MNRLFLKLRAFFVAALLLVGGLSACNKDEPNPPEWRWPEGEYTPATISRLPGFWEEKEALLLQSGLSEAEFIAFSTDSSWHLSPANRTRLRNFRNAVNFPDETTLMQKVIPLQDVALYMNNTYGGTVGGFLNVAADTKWLHTQYDIYYGLRLDYPGTKFLPNGAGYAVIRFTSSQTQQLAIPYCQEMGGTYAHAWPNTGGGFTSSTLGEGGFPEYTFTGYYPPDQGGEIYEVTPQGNEILRATYQATAWVTTEPELRTGTSAAPAEPQPRNGLYGLLSEVQPDHSGDTLLPLLTYRGGKRELLLPDGERLPYHGTAYSITSFTLYRGYRLHVRGRNDGSFLLTTTDSEVGRTLGMELLERGLWGISVEVEEVGEMEEEINGEW